MGKVAFVFPGQASQYPGMGKELAENYAVARSVFEEADSALGFSISKMCCEGTEEELKQTAITQPAILACSVAVFRVAAEKGLLPDFVAGHSLGEYSALVAAGALKFSDAVQLVRKRGTYMQEAVPQGVGGALAEGRGDDRLAHRSSWGAPIWPPRSFKRKGLRPPRTPPAIARTRPGAAVARLGLSTGCLIPAPRGSTACRCAAR